MSSLRQFVEDRKKEGVKNRTVNYTLQVIRHLLKQATDDWLDKEGKGWLLKAPKIKLLPQQDSRKPYPISWEEQEILFSELPIVLKDMALFAVNTGCRSNEICKLRWEWECFIPELGTNVFMLPGWYHDEAGELTKFTKTGEDRLVVLNRIAKDLVEQQRGQHGVYVFVHKDRRGEKRPYTVMSTSGWKAAKRRVGLTQVRFHDLRHTFGRRLRAAGVSFEDRQDLLGHKSTRMTTHYSPAEIKNLLDAVNKICNRRYNTPTLTMIKANNSRPANVPQGQLQQKEKLGQLVDLSMVKDKPAANDY